MVGNIYITGGGQWQNTSVAASGTPEIYTDYAVGIGTDNPINPLHVLTSSTDVAKFESTSAGAGVALTLDHNSASPADDDNIGKIVFNGKNDANQSTTYADIKAITTDVSDSSEDCALTFNTRGAGSFAERLRIQSGGNVLVGNTTGESTASPVNLSLGGTYSNNGGQNPKLNLWDNGTNYMSLGVSSNQLDFMVSHDDYDFVWYGQNDSNNGPQERMRLDNGEKLLDFADTSKIRLKGSSNNGTTHAHINIGSDGTANSDTRAIDIWGNWQNQESKSITWAHGSSTSNMVCQQRVRYNSSPSSTYYEIGRFYHGQDTTAFPVRFVSTSTTTTNLELDGNLKVPSGNGIDFSATANSSGSVGSEVFKDYEEGTWTPQVTQGVSGTPGYSLQIGWYTKIGRIVTLYFYLRFSSSGNTGSNSMFHVGNFPFPVASNHQNTYNRGMGVSNYHSIPGFTSANVSFYGAGSSNTYASLYQGNTGVATNSSLNNQYIIGGFEYISE